MTWWHLSDLSACYKPQHQKSIKKQRKQRKNGQIKVDIIFSAFWGGGGGGLGGERGLFFFLGCGGGGGGEVVGRE